jgi:2-amino-4-hydroxy-6-hydroxymethyldihydropteridine diphosphokinase
VNAVAIVDTTLSPSELLQTMLDVERLFGRIRGRPNAARTLDLDLLDYDGRVEKGPPILPHPRIEKRGFVLVPLSDIEPHWRHPVSGKSVGDLLSALPLRERHLARVPNTST